MELKSDSTQQNYWMIQYQRLLDAKPLTLRMQVQYRAGRTQRNIWLPNCALLKLSSYCRRPAWRRSWSTCCANCPLSTICPSWLIIEWPLRPFATWTPPTSRRSVCSIITNTFWLFIHSVSTSAVWFVNKKSPPASTEVLLAWVAAPASVQSPIDNRCISTHSQRGFPICKLAGYSDWIVVLIFTSWLSVSLCSCKLVILTSSVSSEWRMCPSSCQEQLANP